MHGSTPYYISNLINIYNIKYIIKYIIYLMLTVNVNCVEQWLGKRITARFNALLAGPE